MSKGGLPLEQLRASCQSKGRMAVFENGGEVLPWHRIADFQILTLQMIAARVLHCMPLYALRNEPPKLYVPGEVNAQTIELRRKVRLYVSKFNPGAKQMASELMHFFRDDNLMVTYDAPPKLRPNTTSRRWSGDAIPLIGALYRLSARDNEDVTHMLLYLNDMTFVGKTRVGLEHEISKTMEHGIEILLVHENDPDRGGCPFQKFFENTCARRSRSQQCLPLAEL